METFGHCARVCQALAALPIGLNRNYWKPFCVEAPRGRGKPTDWVKSELLETKTLVEGRHYRVVFIPIGLNRNYWKRFAVQWAVNVYAPRCPTDWVKSELLETPEGQARGGAFDALPIGLNRNYWKRAK